MCSFFTQAQRSIFARQFTFFPGVRKLFWRNFWSFSCLLLWKVLTVTVLPSFFDTCMILFRNSGFTTLNFDKNILVQKKKKKKDNRTITCITIVYFRIYLSGLNLLFACSSFSTKWSKPTTKNQNHQQYND